MNIGLLLLRLTVGLTLAARGTQELLGWLGGPWLNTTGQFFAVLGFPPGRRHALMAALGETVSGVLLAVGLATPAAVAVVVSVMLVAAVTAQIAVSSRNDPTIGWDGASSAHTLKFVFLQNTQQSNLGFGREISNFVKEDRAPVGQFEAS
jgi:uncharacterized membrane protein YphA (DoxX/SURF4 family)